MKAKYSVAFKGNSTQINRAYVDLKRLGYNSYDRNTDSHE